MQDELKYRIRRAGQIFLTKAPRLGQKFGEKFVFSTKIVVKCCNLNIFHTVLWNFYVFHSSDLLILSDIANLGSSISD